MPEVAKGCLMLADIGGYTSYLSGVELEHSHDILADLIGTVTDQLTGPLRLAKLEGDAVFCCDPDDSIDGASLLTAIESCYFAFARRQRTISVATSCECDACRRIPDLDLKFLAHHGSFVEHEVAGSRELVGPDVVLAHRLLKNSVEERSGLRGYALLTEASVARLGIDPAAIRLIEHRESFPDVGDVPAWLLDLESRWRDEQERAAVMLEAEEADLAFEADVPVSPAAAWEALTNPAHQLRWRVGADRVDMENPGGARGVGSTTHCVHGKTTIAQEIIDWKPHAYYSYKERNPIGDCIWTVALDPLDHGDRTQVVWRIKLAGGLAQRLAMTVMGRRVRKLLQENLDGLVAYLSQ